MWTAVPVDVTVTTYRRAKIARLLGKYTLCRDVCRSSPLDCMIVGRGDLMHDEINPCTEGICFPGRRFILKTQLKFNQPKNLCLSIARRPESLALQYSR